jgi:hypothetical protein
MVGLQYCSRLLHIGLCMWVSVNQRPIYGASSSQWRIIYRWTLVTKVCLSLVCVDIVFTFFCSGAIDYALVTLYHVCLHQTIRNICANELQRWKTIECQIVRLFNSFVCIALVYRSICTRTEGTCLASWWQYYAFTWFATIWRCAVWIAQVEINLSSLAAK